MTRHGAARLASLARQALCLCAGAWLTVAAVAAEIADPESASPEASPVTVIDGKVSGMLERTPIATAKGL